MKSMKIIFRCCAKVSATGSVGRPWNLKKEEIILKCLKSILESCSKVKNKISIEIVDDSSPTEFLEKIEKISKSYRFKIKIHRMKFGNNGKSLEYCYKIGEKTKEDLIYFCEDDYFHLPEAMEEIFYAYKKKIIGTDVFGVFPADHRKLYIKLFPSFIYLGKTKHWRSTIATTGTFIIPNREFKKNIITIKKFAEINKSGHGGENQTLFKVWMNKVPCISPIPSLAAHLHKGIPSHFIDWKKEIKKIKI